MSGESAAIGVAAEALLAEAASREYPEFEVFEKRGRSRRFERRGERESASQALEAGWAVRAGDRNRSFFFAATGAPAPPNAWPDATPHPLLLPTPSVPEPWEDPEELGGPLATESEAWGFLDALAGAVAKERPGARLVAARLEEGVSESALVSSRGVRAQVRARAAALRCEVQEGACNLTFEGAGRSLRGLRVGDSARRIVERLTALQDGAPGITVGGGPATVILEAPLAARLVQVLAPWFAGRGASARWAGRVDGEGRIAAPEVTLIDDGRLPEGLLAAATDGEGTPCRRVELIAEGHFVGPLLAWWEGRPASGCARRASYRDLPRRAPTHCYLAPGDATLATLVESAGAGYLLLDVEGGVKLDAATASFSAPVSGFALSGGRAVGPLGPRVLTGSISDLLRGVTTCGRDLTFVPGDGMFGAPPLVVRGLTLAPAS